MSSTTSRALLRAWQSVPLPSLRQGGTLSIRGSSRGLPTPLRVRIVPEWRDDAVLSLEQTVAMPTPPPPPFSLDDERDDLVGGDGADVGSSTDWLKEVEAHMEVKVDEEGVETSMGRRAPLANVIVGPRSATMASRSTRGIRSTKERRKSWAEMDLERNPDRCFGLANPQAEEPWATEEDYPYHSYDHAEERRRQQNAPTSSCSSGSLPAGDSGQGGMEAGAADSSLVLTARVPEKLNVTCHLDGPGDSICVEGKVEGDADLLTASGDISVTKLRGHNVRLSAGGGGIVHASKLIEAERVELSAEGDRGRVRATMINGSDVSIHIRRGGGGRMVGGDDDTGMDLSQEEARGDDPSSSPLEKLDVDDQLASVDVGSLYTSRNGPGASVVVDHPCGSVCVGGGEGAGADRAEDGCTPTLGCGVRIKSNHGHVSVRCVATSAPETSVDEYGREIPLVELGGVNGSCDVSIVPSSASSSSSEEEEGGAEGKDGVRTTHEGRDDLDANAAATTYPPSSPTFLAARVHFDSFSPNSVSLVTCGDIAGDVELTLDRKAEAEVRLVSCPEASSLDMDAIIDDDDEEERATVDALMEHQDRIARSGSRNSRAPDTSPGVKRISIATGSFSAREGRTALADDGAVEYISGFIENKSREPDSRFDVKTKGERATGAGKINVANAADQALHGFSSSGAGQAEGRQQQPLLAVATSGKILMETVSWFGAIARRYGIEDNGSSVEDKPNP